MKRRIRLTESQLHDIIKESVKQVLIEGGHLYHKDEEGNIYTNSKETYRGVPGTVYIWHGEWSDPEIVYKGHEFNANDIEDSLWYAYEDFCNENGETPTNEGFEDWLDVDNIKATLDEFIALQ